MDLTSSASANAKYSFDPGVFAEHSFEASTFLAASKDITTLEVLRDHLRGYERDLKEELYTVINRDLADYLSLSSKELKVIVLMYQLAGVGTEVTDLKAPLQDLQVLLQEARGYAAGSIVELRTKLERRQTLGQRRESLQRRLHFLQTLKDTEALLGIKGEEGFGKWPSSKGTGSLASNVENGTASPDEVTAHCAVLERVAHAWLSLTTDAACLEAESVHSQSTGPARQLTLRLAKIEKATISHLVSSFRVIVCPKSLTIAAAAVQDSLKVQDTVQINETALRHVWRSFRTMSRGGEAEKHLARLLMLPFIDLNFTQGRLDGGSRGSCGGLKEIFSSCLLHIKRNLGATLRCAEDCSGSLRESQHPAIDLVVNGVWKPVQQALCTRLNSIFAPGIASILHANYLTSLEFLNSLASVCGPEHRVAIERRLRRHPSTREFGSRWNLPVYFHLRFSEISSSLDAALSSSREAGAADSGRETSVFVHPIFDHVTTALEMPWRADVFLAPLLGRFFRLTLQIISRFHGWLAQELSDKIATLNASKVEDLVAWLWDAHLFSSQVVAQDLHATMMTSLRTELGSPSVGEDPILHDTGGTEKELREILEGGLLEALAPFHDMIEKMWKEGVETQITEQAIERLQSVRGITATYRMTNKQPPDRPSPFMLKILEPILLFDSSLHHRVPPTVAQSWRARVADKVSHKYLILIKELLSSVDQMEDALKKRKQRAAAKGGGQATETAQLPGSSDTEKIKSQLLLDSVAFAQELRRVADVEALECEPYRELLQAVAPAMPYLDRIGLKMEFPLEIEAFLGLSESRN